CVLYCAAYPLKVTQSGVICSALVTSRPAGLAVPGELRYHSLETRTYCRCAGGMFFGSTTIAPYIPLAMCMNAGAVPQWYMYTPGAEATKLNVFEPPGATWAKSTFGATCAAWKSTECAIIPLFVRVTSTLWPCR